MVAAAEACVADTGVFLRWFVDQDGFEHARELQQELVDVSATVATVDFARVEVTGVLRKKGLLAGRLTAEEFTAAVRVIDDIGVTVHATTADRLERAAGLAARAPACSRLTQLYAVCGGWDGIAQFVEAGTPRDHVGL